MSSASFCLLGSGISRREVWKDSKKYLVQKEKKMVFFLPLFCMRNLCKKQTDEHKHSTDGVSPGICVYSSVRIQMLSLWFLC